MSMFEKGLFSIRFNSINRYRIACFDNRLITIDGSMSLPFDSMSVSIFHFLQFRRFDVDFFFKLSFDSMSMFERAYFRFDYYSTSNRIACFDNRLITKE